MKLLADENVHTGIIHGVRKAGYDIVFVPDIGFAGCDDQAILDYAQKHDLILLSGDKDFGGLVEFGMLWGRGKVILLRYRLINIDRMVKDIIKLLMQEKESFEDATSLIIVLSESGYRIHRQPARKR